MDAVVRTYDDHPECIHAGYFFNYDHHPECLSAADYFLNGLICSLISPSGFNVSNRTGDGGGMIGEMGEWGD